MKYSVFGSYIPNGILGQVRVVFLSDIHCKQYKVGFGVDITQPNALTEEEKLNISIQNLPCGDILIIPGDFVETGLVEELEIFNRFLKDVMMARKFKHIVFICGNHERTIDIDFYNSEGWRYHKTPQDVQLCRHTLFNELPENVHYLFDNHVVLEGLKIYGTPWVLGGETFSSDTSPSHFRWAYSLTEEELVAKYAQIPEDVDILVTHMPPFGIGDCRRNYDKDCFDDQERQVFGYDHVGSTALALRLQALRPHLHCFGHIHSGYGAYRPQRRQEGTKETAKTKDKTKTEEEEEGATSREAAWTAETLFVNAANCDEDYFPTQPALVVDICRPATADVLIDQRYSKAKLDTAIAILVAIDSSPLSETEGKGEGEGEGEGEDYAVLKRVGCSYLKQVLQANYSNSSNSLPQQTRKKEKEKAKDVRGMKAAVAALEGELARLLPRHSLLQALHAARRLSRGGLEDSTDDFRSMQLVVPHLYIGSVYPSECKDTLESFGITHICNCCNGWEPSFPGQFCYLSLPVEDEASQDLSGFFIDCIAFIDVAIHQRREQEPVPAVVCHFLLGHSAGEESASGREDESERSAEKDTSPRNNTSTAASNANRCNNVFIHCQLGISRSAAMVIAYLMFTLHLTYRQASALLKRARPFVCPNQGFIDQLLLFEASLRL